MNSVASWWIPVKIQYIVEKGQEVGNRAVIDLVLMMCRCRY